jgi:phosphoribosylamine--glycine ligase
MLRLREFGRAGETIIIEDFLEGVECSVLALVDGTDLYVLPPCQDHKPVGEGNTGPNTGGMGAFCPSTTLSEMNLRKVESDVLVPIIDALRRDGAEYYGCLYAGLMLTPDGVRVLEFNVRFGDPETQPLMARWQGDLLAALYASSTGGLADFVESGGIDWKNDAAVCVVLASHGYPGDYATGQIITGVAEAGRRDAVTIFHAGTAREGNDLVTSGGRVLGVTATGETMPDARKAAYDACEQIKFDGMHYRRDIGKM